MTSSGYCGPPTTNSTLTFLTQPTDGAPAFIYVDVDPVTGERDRNYGSLQKEVVIENLRGQERLYTIHNAGFQLGYHPSAHKFFKNSAEIEQEYYPECAQLLRSVTGAKDVFIFDKTIRRRKVGTFESTPDERQPAAQVHVDQTYKAALARVHRHLPPAEVPSLLLRRFQIINLWRPIKHPAFDWPLAVCDYRSVKPQQDLFPLTIIYPDSEGQSMGVQYNPNQKWKYFYGLTPDEYILIKCFDTVQDGSVAVYTPHAGFEDPATPDGSPLRESIEVRALVFYD
ncbi:hypothetical protein BDN72DRAFT_842263 [Pluteus cervinus]|uniref:Uncharacterized protein n=1 Tax=Pluteus cervinus TaxID=181527 RepID=A0ACD3AR98_9AGAR|nr:hypothetical protein BDN72DRAFT_842263 [Pluteus cervinus]